MSSSKTILVVMPVVPEVVRIESSQGLQQDLKKLMSHLLIGCFRVEEMLVIGRIIPQQDGDDAWK